MVQAVAEEYPHHQQEITHGCIIFPQITSVWKGGGVDFSCRKKSVQNGVISLEQ